MGGVSYYSISSYSWLLPSIRDPASSPVIGHDLTVVYTQIWLANIWTYSALLKYTYRWDENAWKVCDWLYHLVCGWLWMLQPVTMHTLPRTNRSILQLTWVLIVVGVYKIYCSNCHKTCLYSHFNADGDSKKIDSKVFIWPLFTFSQVAYNKQLHKFLIYMVKETSIKTTCADGELVWWSIIY